MANEFYDHGAYPAPNSLATSTELRAEFDLVEVGFNKLPTMAANAGKKVIVNPTSDALTVEDDNATNVSFTPAGSIAATNVQAAIQELNSEKQPIDAELTAIAGLATTDSNFIVGNGSTWVAESGATARTSLGLGNVDNTSDATKNAASATLTNKTVALGSNTVSGTKAQFDTAVTDDNFAYVGTSNSFSVPQTVSANSTSAALTITQTGTGNVLVVGDEAGDTTPFVIDSDGRVGIGGSPGVGNALRITGSYNTGTSPTFLLSAPNLTVNQTIGPINFQSYPTADIGYSGSAFFHFLASDAALTNNPTIGSQYGFFVGNNFTKATNNYGFHSDIAAATGRWSFYAKGSAANYFAGNVGIGTADYASSVRLAVASTNVFDPSADTLSNTTAHLVSGASAGGIGAYGASLTLGRATGSARPSSGIATVQTGVDSDQCGLAFFVHSTINADNLLTKAGEVTHQSVWNLPAVSTSRTSVTAPADSDGNVFSGTYTPTLTNVLNLDASTAYECQYMRVGNVVTVSGKLSLDATATGRVVLRMTLPIASALTTEQQLGGAFGSYSSTLGPNGGGIYAETTNDAAAFDGLTAATTNLPYAFSFTYRVI